MVDHWLMCLVDVYIPMVDHWLLDTIVCDHTINQLSTISQSLIPRLIVDTYQLIGFIPSTLVSTIGSVIGWIIAWITIGYHLSAEHPGGSPCPGTSWSAGSLLISFSRPGSCGLEVAIWRDVQGLHQSTFAFIYDMICACI